MIQQKLTREALNEFRTYCKTLVIESDNNLIKSKEDTKDGRS